MPCVIVVMGVSGSGKSSIGVRLAERLGWRFADADDFQNAANIAKMHGGHALTDEDRAPWLRAVAAQIDAWRAQGEHGVMTCSALKRAYRAEVIGAREDVRLVYLKGDRDLIRTRLDHRRAHFMPASLLDSQFDALEAPAPEEQAITVSIDQPIEKTVEDILGQLTMAQDVEAS
jgi:carbohydrate kinase (thermoresistant glucokinase family)